MDYDRFVDEPEPRLTVFQIALAGALVLSSTGLAMWTAMYFTGTLYDPCDWVVSGVSLGMTEAEARAAFEDSALGDWTPREGCDGLAYEWRRRNDSPASRSTVTVARMEFHEGRLVALRMKRDRATKKHVIEVMSDAVREDRAVADGETIVMVSRRCPIHQAEATQILASRS